MIKVLYAKMHEEIVFGLRFVREIDEMKEEGTEIVLEVGSKSVTGVKPVLCELQNIIGSMGTEDRYLADDAVSRIAEQHENAKGFEVLLLRQTSEDSGNISIFDTVTFARAYRHLLEGGKMNGKDLKRFLAVQDKLAARLNFTRYPVSSFEYADLYVGRIVEIKPVENSDKLFVEKVVAHREFQVVSGLRKHYAEGDLLGKKFVFLLNIKPVLLAGVRSEGMILCVSNEENTEAIEIPEDIEAGARLELDACTVPVIKTFERPVFDMKRERAKTFMKNLRVEEHSVVFGNQKVLCSGKEVRTNIACGPIS